MDTIIGFFQSLAISSDAQYALFLLTTGATVFLFALGDLLPGARGHGSRAPAPERDGVGTRGRAASSPHASCRSSSRSAATSCRRRAASAGRWSSGSCTPACARQTPCPSSTRSRPVSRSPSCWRCWWAQPGCRNGRHRKSSSSRCSRPSSALMLPNYVLDHMVERRQKRLRDALPGCARPSRRLRRGRARIDGRDPARVATS